MTFVANLHISEKSWQLICTFCFDLKQLFGFNKKYSLTMKDFHKKYVEYS